MLTEEVRQIQERAARRMPDPWEVENLCESWLEQSATIVLLREALEPFARMGDPADYPRLPDYPKRLDLPIEWFFRANEVLSALPEQAGNLMQDKPKDIYICGGCRVRTTWEHRCWGDKDDSGRQGRHCECLLCNPLAHEAE